MSHYISLETQDAIILGEHIHCALAKFLNLFCLFCLLKRTPPGQAIVRNYLILIEALMLIIDIFVDVLTIPIPLFPILAGYCVGPLCRAGLQPKIVYGATIVLYSNMGFAILMCLIFRHQTMLLYSSRLKLSNRSLVAFRFISFTVVTAIPILFMILPANNDEMEEEINAYEPDIAWIRSRGGPYFFQVLTPIVLTLFWILLAIMIVVTICVLATVLHIIHVINMDSPDRNSRKSNAFRRSVFILLVQLAIPLLIMIVPGFVVTIGIATESLVSSRVCMAMFYLNSMHSVVHNLLLIGITPAYRGFISSLLTGRFQRRSTLICHLKHHIIAMEFYQTVDIITKASVVPGICLNLMLIYLVKNYSRAELGTFRYLLIVFAIYDILLIILHFTFDPKYLVLPGIFCAILDFPYGSPMLTLFHCVCFMVSYAILITHLLYRYWVIQKPQNIALFSNPKFIFKLCASVVATSAMVVGVCYCVLSPESSVGSQIMRAEFRRKFGKDIVNGWVVAEYRPNGHRNYAAIFAAATVDAVGVAIIIAVITLSSLTYHHISSAFGLSASTRHAQMLLLRTVCVQTFIPLVCVAIPYFCNTTLPIFGYTLPLVTETAGISMSLFPSWDPLAVIVLMKPYRDGLWSIIRKESKLMPIAPITMTDFTEQKK